MPRSNQTKHLLAESLQELMVTTPLEKISVNDIVDHAGVGRNTFYYHFEDKYDLVNWYFQSGITQFLVERGAYTSWDSLLAAIRDYFLENKVFYCNALAYNGQNSLQKYMFDYLCSIFEQNARELNPDISASETCAIGQFFSGALMGILIPWVLGGMRTNGLVISDLTIPVFNHDILQKLLHYFSLYNRFSGRKAFIPIDINNFIVMCICKLNKSRFLSFQGITVLCLLFGTDANIQRNTLHISRYFCHSSFPPNLK